MDHRLGSGPVGAQYAFFPVNDKIVDAVLDVRGPIGDPKDPLGIRFILGEEQRRIPVAVKVALAQPGVDGLDDAATCPAR
jgi:hypothetical protein